MAKEVTEGTVEKMREYPARLQMAMLAPVRAIAASIPEGDKEVRIVGYVFGEARGVSYRNNPNSTDGTAAEALIGVFEGIPSYQDFPGMTDADKCEKRAELGSGVCFLPPQAQAAIVSAVRGPNAQIPDAPKRGQRVDQLGVSVPIALEIGIRKSSSPVGYEWVTRGLANVKAISPIDRMRQTLGLQPNQDMRAAIADGTLAKIVTNADKGGTAALPAPSKSASSKKSGSRKR